MGNYRMCVCFFTRKFRITEAQPPPDVKDAFKKYSGGGTHMTAEQLRQFLVEVQGDAGATTADAEKFIEQVVHRRHHILKFTRHHLTLDDFHHYLFSADLNSPIGSEVHQDMKAPLNHYFIYTGHNSYLTGNQLSSVCSDVPIVKALKRGVRVIELDIWPNSTKDNVHVLHGRTLTTPVELIRCLKSIKEHAFSTSTYPVVITLEDHLTPDLQAKVAEMFTQTFGDMLFYPKSERLEDIPSPEELKYRIIVSTKPPKEYLEAKSFKDKGKNSKRGKDLDEDVWGEKPLDLPTAQKIRYKSDSDKSEHNQDDQDNSVCDQESLSPGAPAYKRLIAIHAGKPKGGLKEALKIELNKIRRLSLSEQALEKATESYGTDAVRFTQKNFLRIYPKGTRFNSSNYKPLIGWMHGAQMVAFNMQGYGRYLWLMHGMFRSNGGCGYVKKPDFLMNLGPDDQVFDPKAKLPVKKTLKVRVYTGDGWHLDFKQTHFDLYSPPDFYTRVGIAGVPADEIMKKTKKKEDNWTPVWDEEFIFPLTVPELALLRVEVHEYDMFYSFAGQTCLPVSELKPGIRAVPLFNRKGEKYSSVRLLMRLERIFKIRIPEPPDDIEELFNHYSENGTMTIEQLHRFLIESQKEETATKDDVQAIFNSLKHLNILHRRGLHLKAFFRFLFGDINSPLPRPEVVHHDMNCPLAHYFLYTGHNSYLTGNQLCSDSSVDPIINALKRGVRVIELDLWPNSTNKNVKVRHGGTRTAPVALIKCLRAIKLYAFHASQYPVIITFEDHLPPNLQTEVAKMVAKTFGSMLYSPESEYFKEFPSPESLKCKIMISTKPPTECRETENINDKGNSKKVKDSAEDEPWVSEDTFRMIKLIELSCLVAGAPKSNLLDCPLNVSQQEDLDGIDYHQDEDVENQVPEYKRLIAIHAQKLKGGLENGLSIDPDKVMRLSLSEQELEDAVKAHGTDIVRFTQRNLLRVYPKGTRIDSSNYNPLVGWMHGAQMVAFNMQGYGKHLWSMQGMFRANGGCGYVKKPDFLLNVNKVFNPDELSVKKILKVKVYMGEGWHSEFRHTHFDRCSPPDFFAEVGISGVPVDQKEEKTKIIDDQWIPVWNEEFEFPLTVPELALLRVVVSDYDIHKKNDFGGQACLPVSELRNGIRAVPLHNRRGVKSKSVKLLMRFLIVNP